MELLRELMRLQDRRGHLTPETLHALARQRNVPLYRIEGLVSFYPHFRTSPPPRASVHVCRDIVCAMAGSNELDCKLRRSLAEQSDIEIREASCLGQCDRVPACFVNNQPVQCQPDEGSIDGVADRVIDAIERLHGESHSGIGAEKGARAGTSPHAWKCDAYADPSQHYATVASLAAAGTDFTRHCPALLKECGLRGMGGAGFPTGKKWELVAAEAEPTKYVICNADESEPGTFKDRVILDELPHLVIEGMLLAGLTIGARQGIVYLRHEYHRQEEILRRALDAARQKGILGQNAAGSGRAFDIEIFVSPGGYILGEETALLEALEDKRGEPRNKPPYPGTHGLWGKPTLINNVETFALATSIIHHGTQWWSAQGVNGACGLKFVSVSGDVTHPGVYEIPLGTTVAQLIDLAGGMKEGKRLKAFLPGGASSLFLSSEHVNVPLDFEPIQKAGSMFGTGAVIVMAQDRNLFELAANLVRFFRNESCGKCVPCRIGTEQAAQLLDAVAAGRQPATDLAILDLLCETLEQTSICGLGQVALKPVLSMLKNFPNEIPQGAAHAGRSSA